LPVNPDACSDRRDPAGQRRAPGDHKGREMPQDARELDDGHVLECDLCIVGAGAAGITIAHALADSRIEICLLESGGFDFEEPIQELYEGTNVGLPYFDLDICRLRMFGGSTNHWAGRCRPLDEIDFEERPWVPLSGWPLTRAELEPHYRAAQEICQLAAYDYTPEPWLNPGQEVLPFDPAKVVSRVWQFSPPTQFGEVYRDALEAASNITIVLHASVVDIAANETGSEVLGLEIETLTGKQLRARARAYVLACGGLENPRLLLAANRQVNAGLGNQQGMVGRCFMEHPHMNAARALVADPATLSFYDRGQGGGAAQGIEVVGCLNQSPARQQTEQVLNFDALFTADNIGSSGYAALRRIWNAAEARRWPDDLSGDLWEALIDIDDTAAGLMGRFGLREYRADNASFLMWCSAEQAPNPDSRVRLGAAVDALGIPRIALDWRLSELDKRSLLAGHLAIAEELGRTGLGRLQIDDWLSADLTGWAPELVGGHHHMGTTRMSRDPGQGVVDPSSRVHGIANLYVAGSSVFPTSGSANPTLTIVALSLRLAEELERRLAS
jgi:choline dehydrogenase-like flavoprotein